MRRCARKHGRSASASAQGNRTLVPTLLDRGDGDWLRSPGEVERSVSSLRLPPAHVHRRAQLMARTVVFLHGAWMTPACWEPFQGYFEERGYKTLAPAWPGKDRSVEEVRADPSPLAGLGGEQIIDHYAEIIQAQSEPPILIGHSFGGLFVQVLLSRGLGAAGRGHRLGPAQGHHRHPADRVPRSRQHRRQPRQPQQGRALDLRAVPLRVREHAARRPSPRGVREVRHSGDGTDLLPGRVVRGRTGTVRSSSTSPNRTAHRC